MAETTSDNRTPNAGDATPKRATSGGASRGGTAGRAASGGTARKRSTSARTPAAKAANKTTAARGARTAAGRRTREAAQAQSRAAKATADQGRITAERVTLTTLGAALEARDRVVGFVNDWVSTFGTPFTGGAGASEQLRAFERRGTTERSRLEREAKRARTRFERELRSRRRDAERAVTRAKEQVANLT